MAAEASKPGVRRISTRELLADLVAMHDPEGILSIHVSPGAEIGERHAPRPGEIALREGIDALRDEVTAQGPRARGVALRSLLERLRPQLDDLVDPMLPGRGRALFAPLGGGAPRTVATREPLATLVALGPTASLRPLLGPLEAGRPAGIIAVSAPAVRAVDWRDGTAEDVVTLEFDDESGEWRRFMGPAAPNLARGIESASQRDLYIRRLREHEARFVAGGADALIEAARECAWERLCIAGDAELVAALSDATGDRIETVRGETVPRHDLSAHELALALAPTLDEARETRHAALVREVCDTALASRGTASLGVDDTLAALAEGRVHLLLLDTRREMAGSVAPDGRLVRRHQTPPGVDPGALSEEPRLVERMIERALATGGDVVALVPAAADALAEWDGVGALLRW
jgi:hypothetical protein